MSDPAEAMYFDAAPLAHVVEYRERERLARIARAARDAISYRGQRHG